LVHHLFHCFRWHHRERNQKLEWVGNFDSEQVCTSFLIESLKWMLKMFRQLDQALTRNQICIIETKFHTRHPLLVIIEHGLIIQTATSFLVQVHSSGRKKIMHYHYGSWSISWICIGNRLSIYWIRYCSTSSTKEAIYRSIVRLKFDGILYWFDSDHQNTLPHKGHCISMRVQDAIKWWAPKSIQSSINSTGSANMRGACESFRRSIAKTRATRSYCMSSFCPLCWYFICHKCFAFNNLWYE